MDRSGMMPASPANRRFHTPSRSWPRGVTQPMPVMTTRRFIMKLSAIGYRARRQLAAGRARGGVVTP